MLAGVCFFSLGDALGKFMVATYSVGELLLLRSVAALVLMSPLIWRSRGAFPLIRRPALQVLRVMLSISEIALFFAAAIYLPLADIITFYLAAPIFVAALSAILLDEHVDIRRWAAVGVGFYGDLIALRPSAGVFDWSAVIALGGSVAFAFLMVVTRSLRGTPDVMLASMQFVGTVVFGIVRCRSDGSRRTCATSASSCWPAASPFLPHSASTVRSSWRRRASWCPINIR